jgi:hypothetical protein
MATKKDNWADDDSSDDESVEEQEQQQPPQQQQQQQQQQQPRQAVTSHQQDHRQQGHGHGGRGHGHDGQKSYPDKRDRDYPREYVKSDPYHPPKSDFIVFVKNLAYSVNDDELGQFFYDHGCAVNDTHVYVDDGRSRGAGVVILANEASYKLALEADGVEFSGRQINVQPKIQKSYNQQGRGDARSRDGPRDREAGRGGFSRDAGRGGFSREGPPRDNRNRDDHRGPGGGRGGNDFQRPPVAATEKSEETPAVRPKLVLASRTTPLEKVGEFVGSNSGIFGAGKARDELALEVDHSRLLNLLRAF